MIFIESCPSNTVLLQGAEGHLCGVRLQVLGPNDR